MKVHNYRKFIFTNFNNYDILRTNGGVVMTLGERLKDARKQAHYTQVELGKKIGALHNSISNWEKGRNAPDANTLERLCQVLGVSADYLVLGEGVQVVEDVYNPIEKDLIRRFRRLNPTAKGAILALCAYYKAAAPKVIPPATKLQAEASGRREHTLTLVGLLSTQSVAAGTGAYLDEDQFEEILLEDTPLTRKAAFYVPVAGDSMEPRFHDGDILAVAHDEVGIGEVGIFTLDGYGYVKMRGKGELLSLNEAYAPIPMTDDISCNGKVLGVVDANCLVDA
jgi:transcriptional regulator with XRE-family HTH domain